MLCTILLGLHARSIGVNSGAVPPFRMGASVHRWDLTRKTIGSG